MELLSIKGWIPSNETIPLLSMKAIIVYERLGDDSDEQIVNYLYVMQQQRGNNCQHKRPRRVINHNHEDGHLRLMNDYFS